MSAGELLRSNALRGQSVSPEVRAHNISVSHFEARQMAYADNKALVKLAGDLSSFVKEANAPRK